MAKQFIITRTNVTTGRTNESRPLTVAEAVQYFGYTLECGASWAHAKGNKKINCNPKNINALIDNLNRASDNTARNGCGDYYAVKEIEQMA